MNRFIEIYNRLKPISLLVNRIIVDSGFRRNDEKGNILRISSFRRKPESSVLKEYFIFQQAPIHSFYLKVVILITLLLVVHMNPVRSEDMTNWQSIRQDFPDPPAQWKSRPLWFWNAPPTQAETEAIMEGCQASGYYGFGILPTEQMKLEFMRQAYLDRYEEAVRKAAQLGMKMCLYDEFWFPSGAAAGQLAREHPEALGKRLDLVSLEVDSEGVVNARLPAGVLMAAVAMQEETHERLNLISFIRDENLQWTAPSKGWKVLIFACVSDGARGLVDYLDPEAVKCFISLTYEKYYQRLGQYFGNTIDSAFYDEPTFHWIEGGRAWTPSFNDKFRRKYQSDPALLYPALWFDIGPETAAARNALFGLRAELFATGFVKTIADWCQAHGITMTGHVDQEEVVNPVGLCGDLIKCFQYQPIPGLDQISSYGRGSSMYKVVSSAAANYNRQQVMTECYGAIDLPVPNLYREVMDQFVKGVNLMVPHAVWYTTEKIIFPPELSFRTPTYAAELPTYNRYVGRLQRILQQGYPVVDIGVLYPIAGLQAGYRFGVGKPYEGGIIPPEADYMTVGEHLSLRLRQDFTYLHPEVLDQQCQVDGAVLQLTHPKWSQRYQVIIVPGGTTIAASNLRKLKAFYDQGGKVIFTTCLPEFSSEPGKDAAVRTLLKEMLPDPAIPTTNAHGGRVSFIPTPDAQALKAALTEAITVPDVKWETAPEVQGGNLGYLHKVIAGREVYFFANSSDDRVEVDLSLRGKLKLETWEPHSGQIQPTDSTAGEEHVQPVTKVRLVLPPVHSVFLVSQ